MLAKQAALTEGDADPRKPVDAYAAILAERTTASLAPSSAGSSASPAMRREASTCSGL